MTPTTPLLVREAIAAAVLTITPDHADSQDLRWNRVRSVRECQGTAVRNFMVRLMPSEELTDSFFGDGRTVGAVVQIWTCYGGLPDDDDGIIIDSDRRQLYLALVDTVDPTAEPSSGQSGIQSYTPAGWVYEDDTPGKVYGHHDFVVRWLESGDV